jgi:hypothetical protein
MKFTPELYRDRGIAIDMGRNMPQPRPQGFVRRLICG